MLITGRKLGVHEALGAGLVSTVITAGTEGSFLAQASQPFRSQPDDAQEWDKSANHRPPAAWLKKTFSRVSMQCFRSPGMPPQVKDRLRRTTLETYRAAESIETFKRVMWRERRPRLLRVLAEECEELDR